MILNFHELNKSFDREDSPIIAEALHILLFILLVCFSIFLLFIYLFQNCHSVNTMKVHLDSFLAPNIYSSSSFSFLSSSPSFLPSLTFMSTADFGFARYLQNNMMAATLCGSPMYMVSTIWVIFTDEKEMTV